MFKAGQVAQADVLQQEAQLAAVEQLLPPLEKQLAQQRDLLTAWRDSCPPTKSNRNSTSPISSCP
jgi:outer membrane protein TolC